MVINIQAFNLMAVLTNIVRFCDKTGLDGHIDQHDLSIGRKTT